MRRAGTVGRRALASAAAGLESTMPNQPLLSVVVGQLQDEVREDQASASLGRGPRVLVHASLSHYARGHREDLGLGRGVATDRVRPSLRPDGHSDGSLARRATSSRRISVVNTSPMLGMATQVGTGIRPTLFPIRAQGLCSPRAHGDSQGYGIAPQRIRRPGASPPSSGRTRRSAGRPPRTPSSSRRSDRSARSPLRTRRRPRRTRRTSVRGRSTRAA